MWEIVLLLLVFILVIWLAFFATKKLASLGKLNQNGRNMQILETMQLGINQYIYLVKIGQKVVVLGVSKDGTRYLCDIDLDSIDVSLYDRQDKTPLFEEYLSKFMDKRDKKKEKDNM